MICFKMNNVGLVSIVGVRSLKNRLGQIKYRIFDLVHVESGEKISYFEVDFFDQLEIELYDLEFDLPTDYNMKIDFRNIEPHLFFIIKKVEREVTPEDESHIYLCDAMDGKYELVLPVSLFFSELNNIY